MKFSSIVFLAVVVNASEKEKTDYSYRKFISPFDNLEPHKTYGPPTQLNYPILARITPINEANLQISDSFQAYIYPILVSPLYFPYYETLCGRPTVNSVDRNLLEDSHRNTKQQTKSFENLEPVQKVFFENFNEAEKDFEGHMQEKKEGTHDFNANLMEDLIRLDSKQIFPMNGKMKELNNKMKDFSTLFANNELDSSSGAENFQDDSENLQSVPMNGQAGKSKESKVNKPSPNVNYQTNIFQCEGLTCPAETESCKVSERAIEPEYNEILKTVFCLSKDGKMLLKKEETFGNPNKGSSMSSTRTHSRNEELKMAAQMKDKFDKAIKNFKTKINKQFGANRR